jgi:hypothetical protein
MTLIPFESDEAQSEWLQKKELDFYVEDVFYHGRAENYPDLIHLAEVIQRRLELFKEITPTIRHETRKKVKEARYGIDTARLNENLRVHLFDGIPSLKYEAEVFDEVYYYCEGLAKKAKQGFDFLCMDEVENLKILWNLCFGFRSRADGEGKWKKFLQAHPELEKVARQIEQSSSIGKNIEIQHEASLIAGEIQFGNWALRYKDLYNLLRANRQRKLDGYIYITCHDSLERYLSNSIVEFSQIKVMLEEDDIAVPSIVIGLGCK